MNKKGVILVIEDDFNIRRSLGEVFRGEDFPVQLAENGREALDLLQTMETLPSLIFLDLMMPVMDGQTFLIELQEKSSDPRFRSIPVVILSAALSEVRGEVVASLRKPVPLRTLCELAEQYACITETVVVAPVLSN